MRDALLIFHFLGLAMGLGTSLAFMFFGIAASKMEKNEAMKFTLNTFALSRMGHIGITLLVLSGIGLMTPYWRSLTEMPLLMVKLFLVLVLAGLIGMISARAKKAQAGDTEKHLAAIAAFGKISLLTGIIIVVLAVLIFS